MTGALILLAAVVVVGIVLRLLHKPDAEPVTEPEATPAHSDDDGVCCGMHAVCEKTTAAMTADAPIYYDDEELDRWAGTAADAYPSSAVDDFRDVMLTLLPADAAGWAASLSRRGIALPRELNDELLMIISDARAS